MLLNKGEQQFRLLETLIFLKVKIEKLVQKYLL